MRTLILCSQEQSIFCVVTHSLQGFPGETGARSTTGRGRAVSTRDNLITEQLANAVQRQQSGQECFCGPSEGFGWGQMQGIHTLNMARQEHADGNMKEYVHGNKGSEPKKVIELFTFKGYYLQQVPDSDN